MTKKKIILATRKSALALAQANLVKDQIESCSSEFSVAILPMTTSGDEQKTWSLEKEGGKGLFTKEIEQAVLDGRADLAVHSAKDLPTDMPDGLSFVGCLPRESVNDVLIVRKGITEIKHMATSSPRRRSQMSILHPNAAFVEIRGNVETRLNKIKDGLADATVLAAAGLKRLGITEFSGLIFAPLSIRACVPAAGQGAIAIQCRKEETDFWFSHFDLATLNAVTLERLFLSELGAGCHSAVAVHVNDKNEMHVFHELAGYARYDLPAEEEQRTGLIKAITAEIKMFS